MTRRRFLGATAIGATGLALRSRTGTIPARQSPAGEAVLDLGRDCALVESLAGYAAAGLEVVRGEVPPRALLVLPGALTVAPSLARELLHRAHAGATVLVESGATFAEGAPLRAHVEMMGASFGAELAAPVALWPRPQGGIPWVEYRWPVAIAVRDFSRALPLVPRTGDEVIARVNELPVATRRRIGRGALLVLGSPLGPPLFAGDGGALALVSALHQAPR